VGFERQSRASSASRIHPLRRETTTILCDSARALVPRMITRWAASISIRRISLFVASAVVCRAVQRTARTNRNPSSNHVTPEALAVASPSSPSARSSWMDLGVASKRLGDPCYRGRCRGASNASAPARRTRWIRGRGDRSLSVPSIGGEHAKAANANDTLRIDHGSTRVATTAARESSRHASSRRRIWCVTD
jgi:hypothetical protein